MLSSTWGKRDKAKLQALSSLTFAFGIPPGYECEQLVQLVACGRGFAKNDPYVVIEPAKCGCTLAQVAKIVDKDLHSRKAFGRMLPVDRHTWVSDTDNGRPKYQYWMSRLYATGHGPADHELVVYGQARTAADNIKIKKIIGDIYDATR